MRTRWLTRARLPVAVLAVLMGMGSGHAQETASNELIVDVVVNETSLQEPQVVRRDGNDFLLSRETLALARIAPPLSAPGTEWWSVDALRGVSLAFDEPAMRMTLAAAPERLETTRLQLSSPSPPLPDSDFVHAPLAGILGYDLTVGRDGRNKVWSSLYLDAAASLGRGSCSTRHLLRTDGAAARLDSNCIVDWPEHGVSMTAGDAIGAPWSLSGSVRYGGVRIGTDFSLQPESPTQPLLAVAGSARVPSMMELWLDQQLLMQQALPAGPFVLENIPPVAGSGEIRAIVIDAAGRKTTLDVPFYSDPHLLRPGLADWSVEIGRPRTGYLTRNDGYGDPFAMLTWRQGLTASWTGELRAELQRGRSVVGLGNQVLLGRFGAVELSAAQSRTRASTARARLVGYRYQGKRWTVGVRDQRRDDGWTDLAYPKPGLAPRREAQVDAGLRFGRVLVTGGGMLRETVLGGRQQFLRAGLTLPVGRGYLSVSAFEPRGAALHARTWSATFTLPLAPNLSLATWADRQGGTTRPGVSLQRNAPAGLGYGYRIVHQDDKFGGNTVVDSTYAAPAYRIEGSASRTRQGTQVRTTFSGALVATREGWFGAQERTNSFAVVRLPDAKARIYRDHQLAAITNARGLAIVPNLRPFQVNHLDVETDDLSLSTRIERPSITLVPGRRQILRADFAAIAVQPMTLRLHSTDGARIPAGAVATLSDGTTAAVGHDGVLYLEPMKMIDAITVNWVGARCRVSGDALHAQAGVDGTLDVPCEGTPRAE